MRSIAIVLLAFGCSSTVQLGTSGSVTGRRGQLNEVAGAADVADDIYRDRGFWDLVRQLPTWVDKIDAKATITGDDVGDALAYVRPAEQAYEIKHLGFCSHLPLVRGSGNADTSSCVLNHSRTVGRCGHVRLSIDHFPWASFDYLVNTIAHENTHTVGTGAGDCGCDDPRYRFTDTGKQLTDGMKAWLVSYRIGDLAQCYFARHRDPQATRVCFDETLNGQRCNRSIVECCDAGHDPDVLKDARANAARCKAITCPRPAQVRCAYEVTR